MVLKKTMGAFFKEVDVLVPLYDGDGNPRLNEKGEHLASPHKERVYIPQVDIDMHPLEEAEILAHWSVGDSERNRPQKPTQEEEHDMLLEHGADHVKQKRKEWQDAHDAFMLKHQPLIDAHTKANETYVAWADSDAGVQHYKNTHGKHIEEHVQAHLTEFFKLNGVM